MENGIEMTYHWFGWWHWKSWFRKQIEFETPYQNGKKHGMAKGWHTTGQPEYEKSYYKGELHGIIKWWSIDGHLDYEGYGLYGREVTEEEYRKHELTKELGGIK